MKEENNKIYRFLLFLYVRPDRVLGVENFAHGFVVLVELGVPDGVGERRRSDVDVVPVIENLLSSNQTLFSLVSSTCDVWKTATFQ